MTHCLDPETLNQETYGRQSAFKTCKGFIEFDAALDIFLDVSQVKVDESRPDKQKTKFKDALLNEESGLRCFIFTGMNNKWFIFLDSDELDLLSYFKELIREEHNFLDNEKFKKQSITNHHQLKSYIKSMETEYDKNVLKPILSILVTDRDLELIGAC